MASHFVADTFDSILHQLVDEIKNNPGIDSVDSMSPVLREIYIMRIVWFSSLCAFSLLLSWMFWSQAKFYQQQAVIIAKSDGYGACKLWCLWSAYYKVASYASFGLLFSISLYYLLQLWLAPQIHLLEYLRLMDSSVP